MKIFNLSDPNLVNGTSFFGDTIRTSFKALEERLGVAAYYFGDEKVTFELELETETGIPFTIYDWKEGWLSKSTTAYLHIGARNAEESHMALEAVKTIMA